MKNTVPTRETAVKIIEILRHGLTHGKGNPIPGELCVEAAVCLALGLPHSDAARAARDAARDAARAASYAARDQVLGILAECAVQALIVCKSPGCEWLDLCEVEATK